MTTIKLTPLTRDDAKTLVTSLPLPPWHAQVRIPGAENVQVVPLGAWPARALAKPAPWGNPPRRALVMARFSEGVPASPQVELVRVARPQVPSAPLDTLLLGAEQGEEVYHHRDEELYHYVRREDAAMIRHPAGRLRLRLGMEVNGQRRYWQWVTAIPAWEGPLSTACTVGGHIYAGLDEDRPMTIAEAKQVETLSYFDECTVSAKAFIVLHADGALEVTCHMANIQGYGRGKLAHGLPIVELSWPDGRPAGSGLPVVEEGTATAEEGTWRWLPLDSTRIWIGNRLPGGLVLAEGKPQPQYVEDSEKGLVPGAGRSFRFAWIPGKAGLPVRCLADPDWYARCGIQGLATPLPELAPRLARLLVQARKVFMRNTHPDGMSRGGIYRYLDQQPDGRYELSLDGNESAFVLRAACLLGDGELYRLGLEAARCVADIGVDHNHFNVHYHGDTPEWTLYSLIYHRFGGLVTAWQETGDPWYRETAEGVAQRWITVNRQNQPRQNMGRDTEPVEGILMLYDATGEAHWFSAAEQIAADVARSLFPDGTWRSGFGVGPYWGTNALHGTAWNGSHLLAGIAEFLFRASPESCPHYDYLLQQAVRLVHGICDSVARDYGGFHRTSGSFIWRRMALVAHLAGDEALDERLRDIVARLLATFEDDPEAFFTVGHHCAGYLDGPWVWQWLHPATVEQVESVSPAS